MKVPSFLKNENFWRSIIAVLSAVGIAVTPEYTEAIIGIAVALFGGTFFVKKKTESETEE